MNLRSSGLPLHSPLRTPPRRMINFSTPIPYSPVHPTADSDEEGFYLEEFFNLALVKEEMGDEQPRDPKDMRYGDRARTIPMARGSAIRPPGIDQTFNLKPNHLKSIEEQKFDGKVKWDPYKHLERFEKLAWLYQYGQNQMNAVKLETFPITLTGDAEDWFNDLPENSITNWDQLKEAFIGEFYSVKSQRKLKNLIWSFLQEDGEDVVDAWDVYAFGGSFSKITPNQVCEILEAMLKDHTSMDDQRFLKNESRFKKGTKEGKVARVEVSNNSGVDEEIQALSARMDKGFATQESRFGYLEQDVKVLADGCDHCSETHYSEDFPNRGPEDVNYVQNQQGGFQRNTGDPNAKLREMMKQLMSNQVETNTSIHNIREDTRELSERLDKINGKVEMNAKNQDINFKDLESRMAAVTRPQGALPSNTQHNPKQNQGPNNGQKYTPPPIRQELVTAISTRTGRSYDPPPMPNVVVSVVQDLGSVDTDVEEEVEMEDNPTLKTPVTPPKPAVIPEAKPYKPKVPFPRRFRKAKLKEQYDKFVDMIKNVHINVPLVDLIQGMPNYAQLVKATYLNAECSVILQNQIPPKLEDPGSFLIICSIRSLTCKALADLRASIKLMPYSVWSKLALGVLRPTRMSIRLADHSFQYPIGITENMTIQVGHIVFLVDFVILEMEEDTKVPLILGRPFLNTANAIIQVKDKEISLGVGTDRIVFNVERSIKHAYSTDESCFRIDVIDDALDQEFQELMETEIDEELTCLGAGDIDDDELFAEVMALSLEETPPEDESFE
uniref:uncharacterized protein LOC122601208 n=1 Tax=Erigeron canadensis TaxID=72917 RepID=UPI001CB8F73B|nr:uncharacterized protein LOC122601208 [Erigeron canadensis]